MKKTKPKPYKTQRGRKSWKVQKGQSRMSLQPNKFAETYIKRKKKKKGREEERQQNVFLYTVDLKLRKGGSDAHFTGRGRISEPEVVLLPRPGLFLGIGWDHIELHTLDLPITHAAH